MTTASEVSIALNCHAACACTAVRALDVTVRATSGRLVLRYALEGDLDALRIPAAGAAERADELWRHTCFEAFIRRSGAAGYCEMNFSPSRAWALYRFTARRQGMAAIDAATVPQISIERSATTLLLTATLALHDLIHERAPLALSMGLAAVLEDEDGRLSYWAGRHPHGKPDFHHPDNFTLEFGV